MTTEDVSPPDPPVSRGGVRRALLAAARQELAEHGHGSISLRAVARRAGVSHAAPKNHFDDRAGLLTAVAAEGFATLAAALRSADVADTADTRARLAALGKAYVDFGLRHPALFDLMYRPSELHPEAPELRAAKREATELLVAAAARLDHSPTAGPGGRALALTSWALVHGLVVLTRDGALGPVASDDLVGSETDGATLAHQLTEFFTRHLTF